MELKPNYAASLLTLQQQPEQTLDGLHLRTSDKTQNKDIPALSGRFYDRTGSKPGSVLPFYVVSKNYDKTAGTFTLFVGTLEDGRRLEQETLPAGTYAKLAVRPALGFLWGPAIGKAKRWFYTQWLPGSDYESLNLEYELHTEKSVGRRPSVALLFAIQRKEN